MKYVRILSLILYTIPILSSGIVFADGVDTVKVVDMETGFDENLDHLLNLWYVQQALQVEYSDSLFYLDEEQTLPDFPDSVYISRLQGLPFLMDVTYNRIVKNFIDLYAKQRRDKVRIMLALSEYYFPFFEEIFDRHGIPDEMKYLSVIESALNPRAVSRAGATGLWQFMYSTGKSYGLVINSLVDERRDVIKSTEAAAKFMKDLYSIYKDWILVIAAYNCGPGNVNKAIRRAGGKRNYWDIYYFLPRETRGYVPAFIAASYLFNYNSDHNLYPARLSFDFYTDTVHVQQKLHLRQVADVLNIPIGQLRDLNPQYRHDLIPADSKSCHLRIPQIQVTRFIELEDSIYAYKQSEYINNDKFIVSPTSYSGSSHPVLPSDKYTKLIYTVKSGDNLGYIASWYNVRISDLRYWNNIRQNLIRSGQRLVIYVPNEKAGRYRNINNLSFEEKQGIAGKSTVTKSESEDSSPISVAISEFAGDEAYIYYTVKQGDTLWDIAKKYPGVSDTDIAKLNNIKSGEKIKPGQVIRIKKSG